MSDLSYHQGLSIHGSRGPALLSCPFCGSAAVMIDNDGYEEYFVGCVNEACEIMPHVDGPTGSLVDGIARWNKRPANDSAGARNE